MELTKSAKTINLSLQNTLWWKRLFFLSIMYTIEAGFIPATSSDPICG